MHKCTHAKTDKKISKNDSDEQKHLNKLVLCYVMFKLLDKQ